MLVPSGCFPVPSVYLDAAILCFESATFFPVGICFVSILVHKSVGYHTLFRMIGVLLGDVGGARRQF